jgi:4'-phosphopantetheinyl transferase
MKSCASVSEGLTRGKPDNVPGTPLTALLRPTMLSAPDIDVWLMPLDIPANRITQCAALLSPDEQARAQRFHFERDRRRYSVARGFLRTLLGNALGLAPQTLQLHYTPHGKPYIADVPAPLHFNVSHTADLAICAISRTCVPGVDIEHVDREIDIDEIAQRFFTPGERAELQRLPVADRHRALLSAWTRKEAIVKSTGDGLRFPLDQIEVTIAADCRPELLSIVNGPISGWSLYDVDAGPDYVASVAAHRASQGLAGAQAC